MTPLFTIIGNGINGGISSNCPRTLESARNFLNGLHSFNNPKMKYDSTPKHQFFYFVFSSIYAQTGMQIHLGRLTFLKKGFFWANLMY